MSVKSTALAGAKDSATGRGLRVPWPRILDARRSILGRFSVNDEAHVEFGPGLLQFLSLRLDTGFALGTGLAPAWSVPVGAGCAAAYAVLELPALEHVNTWAGLGTTMRWRRAGIVGETLDAHARLAKLGKTSATLPYEVHSREQGDLLVEGEFILVSVGRNGPRPFVTDAGHSEATAAVPAAASVSPMLASPPVSNPAQPAINPVGDVDSSQHLHPDSPRSTTPVRWTQNAPALTQKAEPLRTELFRVTAPSIVARSSPDPALKGCVWEWLFPSDLLRLMVNPLAGATEPLGRRFHPYGRVFESMSLHAALAMTSGSIPQSARVRRRKPVSATIDFGIRSEVINVGKDWVTTEHRLRQGPIEIGEVEVTVTRTPGLGNE